MEMGKLLLQCAAISRGRALLSTIGGWAEIFRGSTEMSTEVKKEIQLEIAHVLFIDIVAYSKMAIDDQRATVEKLNQIVQSTDEFRKAESENRLLKIATGDGMGR